MRHVGTRHVGMGGFGTSSGTSLGTSLGTSQAGCGLFAALALALALLVAAGPDAFAEDLFPRPPGILPRVALWKRVYAEVDSNGGLIHDSELLDVVYEVIRWPKGLTAAEEESRIERAKDHYARLLKRLASESSPLTTEERRVLALFPPGVSPRTLRDAADRVRFQRGLADRFRDGLIRSGRWEPHIRRVFRDNGLPEQLAALPHVESSFNPLAYSKAGAAGLWQFMPSTGRRYLRIDRAVDERFDPWRASEAAAALLAENYRITGTWPLAITSYNHGAGGVMRAVKQLGTRDISVLIDRYDSPTWGFASRNFYACFLAALDVDESAARYFGAIEREKPAPDEVVVTHYPTSAAALARTFGVDVGLLRELNLGLRDSVWSGRVAVPAHYAVRVPRVAGRAPAEQLVAQLPRIEQRPAGTAGGRYRVRHGDTLWEIARRYGVSTSALARANRLRTSSHLRVGQVLRIPGKASAKTASSAPPASAPAAGRVAAQSAPGRHRVRSGDTLWDIARDYGVSTSALARANGIRTSSHLRVGQVLRIPGSASETTASAAPSAGGRTPERVAAKPRLRRHTVKRGETLFAISRRTGVSIADLAAENDLEKPYRLQPGQELRIPKR